MNNNHKDQPNELPQPAILAEPTPSSISSLPSPPELEIRFEDFSLEQQEMVTQALIHHLGETLADGKAMHAAGIITRFSLQIGEIYVEFSYQLDMLDAKAQGIKNYERVARFLDRRGERLFHYLETYEYRLATLLEQAIIKPVYPKPKLKSDIGSLVNIRLLTNEKTEIKQASESEENSSMPTGTFFGTGLD